MLRGVRRVDAELALKITDGQRTGLQFVEQGDAYGIGEDLNLVPADTGS
jgi:hypothetical protein